MRLNRLRVIAASVASVGLVIAGLAAAPTLPAIAADAVDFNAGYIISDANFYDNNAMSQAEIQAFLEEKVGACTNSNCLSVLTVDTFDRPANMPCSAYAGAAAELASTVIFKVQQACGISAKALLVTLQKEQGLLTKAAPTDLVLRKAMGYGCPDTAACDSRYYGFYNQVYNAAWQLGWYRHGQVTPGSSFYNRMMPGRVSEVRFNPTGCGAAPVLISNYATAALYFYTPYQPNDAAMVNLYGVGDSCSSYGNRNFWRFFTDWFGSPIGIVNPTGVIDTATATSTTTGRLTGWMLDPDSDQPIDFHVYVDGVFVEGGKAALPRPDVQAAFPRQGSSHGFDISVPMASGDRQVCVYGINVSFGLNSLIGCVRVVVPWPPPSSAEGWLDSVSTTAVGVRLAGWALDPSTSTPVGVHVYVDGAFVRGFLAADQRRDVAAVFPFAGAMHGFDQEVRLSAGPHTVCLYGLNANQSISTLLGCRAVTVLGTPPRGHLDSVNVGAAGVRLTGWALDPAAPGATNLHVYVDGRFATGFPTSVSRPDVAAVFAGYGQSLGFDSIVNLGAGRHDVCVFALSAADEGSALLGCSVVAVS